MKKALDYLKSCGYWFLATDEGGQPRVRPFGAACEFEGKLYFTTSNEKNVYRQIVKNPKVEVSAFHPADGTWIRITGELVTDDRHEARAAMMEANKDTLSKMYTVDDGKFTVMYFKDAKAVIYSFTAPPEEIEL